MAESMIERATLAVVEVWQKSDNPPGTVLDCQAVARAVIESMREPTDFQRNKYYELSGNMEVMVDSHWERAIDAALIWPAGSAGSAGVPMAED